MPSADIAAQKNAPLELKLRRTQDISTQLTNTEWFMSMPGSADQKRPLIECMSCHTFERIVRSKFNAQEFFGVLNRMAMFANNTTMAKVQARVAERKPNEELARKLASRLKDWTGRTWLIAANGQGGGETLIEQQKKARAAEREAVESDAFIQSVLTAFPGAKLGEIRTVAPTLVTPEIPDEAGDDLED